MGDPYFVRDDESCMAVNPRSAVPSGSRLFGVVDTDTQYVFFVSMEEWGQVVVQPDITVGPVSEFMSVDPDGAVRGAFPSLPGCEGVSRPALISPKEGDPLAHLEPLARLP